MNVRDLGGALRRCVCLLAVMLIVAACSSSAKPAATDTSGTTHQSQASLPTALGYVPQDAAAVVYVDLAALGHPAQPWASSVKGIFGARSATIQDAVGVNIGDADWEIDTARGFTDSGAAGQTASLSLPHIDLLKFADGLARAGFARQAKGSVTTLTCPDIAARCGTTTWAFGNFRVDLDAAVLTEYARGIVAPTPSSAFGRRAATLLDHTHAPVGFSLSLGAEACEDTRIRERNPAPPQQIIDALDAIVGKFSPVRGALLTVDNRAATRASGYIELADHAHAAAELAGRATVQMKLDSADIKRNGVRIKAVRTDGVVDVYAITGKPGGVLPEASLGINICPTS